MQRRQATILLHAPVLLGFLVLSLEPSYAQDSTRFEQQARDAVHRIVRHSGLLPNFVVRENAQVRTAVSFIKDRQRVIEYNPAFIAIINDSTRTDWGAVSVLAHEIAHHLLGHTLDPGAMRPGDELACDRYSGFILRSMGASLVESRAAMEITGDPHGTRRHPPRSARLLAIEQGWYEADAIARGMEPVRPDGKHHLRYVVSFIGDRNTYYVDSTDRVVWYDEFASPIEFGRFTELAGGDFTHQLTWDEEVYFVDRDRVIWKRTEVQLPLKVGRMLPFDRQP